MWRVRSYSVACGWKVFIRCHTSSLVFFSLNPHNQMQHKPYACKLRCYKGVIHMHKQSCEDLLNIYRAWFLWVVYSYLLMFHLNSLANPVFMLKTSFLSLFFWSLCETKCVPVFSLFFLGSVNDRSNFLSAVARCYCSPSYAFVNLTKFSSYYNSLPSQTLKIRLYNAAQFLKC